MRLRPSLLPLCLLAIGCVNPDDAADASLLDTLPEAVVPAGLRAPVSFTGSRWEYLASTYDADGDGRIEATEYNRGEGAFDRLDANGDRVLSSADFSGGGSTTEMLAQAIFHCCFHSDEDLDELVPGEVADSIIAFDDDEDDQLDRDEFDLMKGEKEIPAYSSVMTLMIGERTDFDLLLAVMDEDANEHLSEPELVGFYESSYDQGFAQIARGFTEEEQSRNNSGPAPGQVAPDFLLSPPDGGPPVRLSSFANERPVALIFGSYT